MKKKSQVEKTFAELESAALMVCDFFILYILYRPSSRQMSL